MLNNKIEPLILNQEKNITFLKDSVIKTFLVSSIRPQLPIKIQVYLGDNILYEGICDLYELTHHIIKSEFLSIKQGQIIRIKNTLLPPRHDFNSKLYYDSLLTNSQDYQTLMSQINGITFGNAYLFFAEI